MKHWWHTEISVFLFPFCTRQRRVQSTSALNRRLFKQEKLFVNVWIIAFFRKLLLKLALIVDRCSCCIVVGVSDFPGLSQVWATPRHILENARTTCFTYNISMHCAILALQIQRKIQSTWTYVHEASEIKSLGFWVSLLSVLRTEKSNISRVYTMFSLLYINVEHTLY